MNRNDWLGPGTRGDSQAEIFRKTSVFLNVDDIPESVGMLVFTSFYMFHRVSLVTQSAPDFAPFTLLFAFSSMVFPPFVLIDRQIPGMPLGLRQQGHLRISRISFTLEGTHQLATLGAFQETQGNRSLREGEDTEVIPLNRKKTKCLLQLQYFGDPFFGKPSASS